MILVIRRRVPEPSMSRQTKSSRISPMTPITKKRFRHIKVRNKLNHTHTGADRFAQVSCDANRRFITRRPTCQSSSVHGSCSGSRATPRSAWRSASPGSRCAEDRIGLPESARDSEQLWPLQVVFRTPLACLPVLASATLQPAGASVVGTGLPTHGVWHFHAHLA